MKSPDGTPGNGLLLFFRVDDYAMALSRARAFVERFEEEPHVNLNTRTKEFSLRDPDGYFVTISALPASELRKAAKKRPSKPLKPKMVRSRAAKTRARPRVRR
jgi:hypothetical protein